MTRRLKAGVIGVGLAGGPHIEAIGRTGLAEVGAVAASSEQSARRAADRHAVAGSHGDWHALVQEPIRGGAIGEVFHVHDVYLQDWLSDAGVRNWRLDPVQSGVSTTFADLGTHWCDLAMHLSGRRIESVCAAIASRHGRPIDDHG